MYKLFLKCGRCSEKTQYAAKEGSEEEEKCTRKSQEKNKREIGFYCYREQRIDGMIDGRYALCHEREMQQPLHPCYVFYQGCFISVSHFSSNSNLYDHV